MDFCRLQSKFALCQDFLLTMLIDKVIILYLKANI